MTDDPLKSIALETVKIIKDNWYFSTSMLYRHWKVYGDFRYYVFAYNRRHKIHDWQRKAFEFNIRTDDLRIYNHDDIDPDKRYAYIKYCDPQIFDKIRSVLDRGSPIGRKKHHG